MVDHVISFIEGNCKLGLIMEFLIFLGNLAFPLMVILSNVVATKQQRLIWFSVSLLFSVIGYFVYLQHIQKTNKA
jgi:hypothetical protein